MRRVRRYISPLSFIELLTRMPYRNIFGAWIGIVIIFAFIYIGLSHVPGNHSLTGLQELQSWDRVLTSLYFSIVTATTVGYGDIVPFGYSRIASSIESILVIFTTGIFVAKLVSYRQEIVLGQMHKLLFEDVFHQTREELFVMRRDFDVIMQEAQNNGTVSPKSWENLSTACFVCQTLLEDIPNFYNDDSELYTIDRKHEHLLLDAVYRSIRQTHRLLDVLAEESISWRVDDEAAKELRELSGTLRTIIPLWKERSQHGRDHLFDLLETEWRAMEERLKPPRVGKKKAAPKKTARKSIKRR